MFDDLTLQRRLFNLLEIVGKGQLTTFVQERETDRQTGRERERNISTLLGERGSTGINYASVQRREDLQM